MTRSSTANQTGSAIGDPSRRKVVRMPVCAVRNTSHASSSDNLTLTRGDCIVAADMAARDPRRDLLDGTAGFAADLAPHDALHLAFVTSPVAHARIERLDTSEAAAAPGVRAVYTATDLPTVPIHEIALIPE